MFARRRLTANTDANILSVLGPPLRCSEQVDKGEEECQKATKTSGRGERGNGATHGSLSCSTPLTEDTQGRKENCAPFRHEKGQDVENDPSQFRVKCQGTSKPLLFSNNPPRNAEPVGSASSKERSTNPVKSPTRGGSRQSSEVLNKPLGSYGVASAAHPKPPIPSACLPIGRETPCVEQRFSECAKVPSSASSSHKLAGCVEETAQTYPDSLYQSQTEEQRVCSVHKKTPTTHPAGTHDSFRNPSSNTGKYPATNPLLQNINMIDGGSQLVGVANIRTLNLPQQFVIIPNTTPSEPDKVYQKLAVIGMGGSSKVGLLH